MKKTLFPKIINKPNLLDNSFNNGEKYTKNSILKPNPKSLDKRNNETLNKYKLKQRIIDKGMYTRQNSTKIIEGITNARRNFSNKKLFLANSYKRREKFNKINEINELESNKITVGNIKLDNKANIKHKKLLTLQTNINNYNYKINKKYNNENNAKNPRLNTNVYKPNIINNKLKEFYTSINKEKKVGNKNNLLYSNYINNTTINKTNMPQNKILNKSLGQRNKICKLKLSQNVKSKIMKSKMNKKEEKTENIFNKTFIINKNNSNIPYSYRNKPPSKIEICQTFSKDGNIKEKENCSTNEQEKNNDIQVNKNEKLMKINTNFKSYNIKNSHSYSIPKTAKSKENKRIKINKERQIRTPMTSKSNNKFPKLKYLIGEYCISNDNNKYSSISKNSKLKKDKSISINNKTKSNFTTGNLIQKELRGIKYYINNFNAKKNQNILNKQNTENENIKKDQKEEKGQKCKNNDIFEVISDIKVKSLNEYEEEKKADSNKKNKEYNTLLNDSKINNNININININYNNININNQINNENNITKKYSKEINNINNIQNINPTTSGVFIEDRDEYNILKETFSKDRFSFRPKNDENNEIITNYQQYNNILSSNINNNKDLLDKNDFINNSIMSSSVMKNNINKNKGNFKNNVDNKKIMKKELSKIQKLKKIIKNKPNSKLVKGGNVLNKSVEMRFKKLNK